MATMETAPAETEMQGAEAAAKQLDEMLLAEAAAQRQTIASIGGKARYAIDEALEAGEIAEEDESAVLTAMNTLQAERMREVSGDTTVLIEHMDANTLGYYDGTDVVLSVDGGIKKEIYKHEGQHREDGMPTQNLDANLAPETGIAAVDEQLEELGPITFRDHLEERATDTEQAAGGEGSALYLRTHVPTVHGLEAEGEAVGVDLEKAAEDLIETHDVRAYQKALTRVAVHKALRENGEAEGQKLEALAEISEEARQDHVHKETRETVADAAVNEFELAA